MGRIVSFSDFPAYFAEISRLPGFVRGTILDTNILIAMSYSINGTAMR